MVVLLLVLVGSVRAGEDWGPWEDRWAPVGAVEAVPAQPEPRRGLFEQAYRWYRSRSDRNGGGCPYYPTCSAYGVLAVRHNGPVLGAVYTVDRLLREYPFMDRVHHYPLVTPHGIPRLYDPPPRRDERRARRRERRRTD